MEGLTIGGASEQKLAQVVTTGIDGLLTSISLPVACASGDLIVEIQGVTAARPNGLVHASETVPGETLPPLKLSAVITS